MTCIFIKGAIAADGMEAAAEHIDFSENLWQKLQEDKDQYFPEQEIVGWFFAQPQIAMEITELFVKEAADAGLTNLKGHRLAGGIRASLYNAQPKEAAQALANFMTVFAARHG